MKYRVTRPFLAFGKAPEVGELVELTPEQVVALLADDVIAPYEVKIEKVPERTPKKKRSGLSPVGLVAPKRTRKLSKKSATK